MKSPSHRKSVVTIVILSVTIPCVIFAISVLRSGERRLGVLETIHGIPYPKDNGSIVILEDMAHTDIFLQEPVFAKQVKFAITFDPGEAEAIDIGIRDNEFWLSYIKYPLYRKGVDVTTKQKKEVIISVSSALQDIDRSVDVMFFTEDGSGAPKWRIHDFRASLEFDMPSVLETKAYVKSILTRERAL